MDAYGRIYCALSKYCQHTCHPLQVAVQEVRRLQRYGVTKPEMERYQMALLRDAEQAAEQSSSIPSVEMLEYSMDSIGLDHTVMDQAQARDPSLSLLFQFKQFYIDPEPSAHVTSGWCGICGCNTR